MKVIRRSADDGAAVKRQQEQMQRHVMSCRRREETAAVVVVTVGEPDRAEALQRSGFRLTDSVTVAKVGDRHEVRAVLDGKDLDCGGVERRIRLLLGDVPTAFGWAFFPEDGVTLEALIEKARRGGARPELGAHVQLGTVTPLRAMERSETHAARPGVEGSRSLSRVLVTGCAGFLGSQLSERLVADGLEVVGVDCFTDYYARPLKEANLERLRDDPRFDFREVDLSTDDLSGLLEGVDTVVHLAAQPGVRGSFGRGFGTYVRNNVQATQRLLEEAAQWPLATFAYASSSSVYGDAVSFPTDEQAERRPVSPYGMTKVATEELAGVYHRTFDVPVVGLRYFTAYGPRQRPDMAFCRFLMQAVKGRPLTVYGDGRQVREFTYVDDVITATVAACRRGRAGSVYNVGGGAPVELQEALAIIEDLLGRPLVFDHQPGQVGDARTTSCDGTLAECDLGFRPQTDLRAGIEAQLEWILDTQATVSVPEQVAV